MSLPQCATCSTRPWFEIVWQDGTVLWLCQACMPRDYLTDDRIDEAIKLDYDVQYGMEENDA